jgi:branched-chain amino acid transport system substrate-binding protein
MLSMNKKLPLLAAAAAFSLLATQSALAQKKYDTGATDTEIKIGNVEAYSGPASAYGIIGKTEEAYFKMVNDAGGINGRKINVLAEDSRYNAATDKISYEKLVGQTPVLGISGMGTSGAQVALAPAIKSGKVPIVGTYTSTKALSEPVSPMVYGGFCGYKEMAQTGIGYFTDLLKLKNPKVMTVHIESAGGLEYAEYVAAAIAKRGGTAKSVSMKVTAADVTPQVLEIIAAKPDFLTIYGVSNTSILTMRALQQYGLKIPAFGITYLGAPQIFTAIGPEAGANYYFVSCFTPGGSDETPGNKELSTLADKYGHAEMKADINYVAGWVTAQMAAESIARLGPEPSRAKLVDSMNKGFVVDSKGLAAPIKYTKEDHTGPVTLKVFGYDYQTKKFKPYGEYSDYQKYLK